MNRDVDRRILSHLIWAHCFENVRRPHIAHTMPLHAVLKAMIALACRACGSETEKNREDGVPSTRGQGNGWNKQSEEGKG